MINIIGNPLKLSYLKFYNIYIKYMYHKLPEKKVKKYKIVKNNNQSKQQQQIKMIKKNNSLDKINVVGDRVLVKPRKESRFWIKTISILPFGL